MAPGWLAAQDKNDRTVLVIHGGAGVIEKDEWEKEGLTEEQYHQALRVALVAGYKLWKEGKSSVDVVEAAIREMEDCELFNAGRGAPLNADGRVELDAAIMEGNMDKPLDENLGKADPRKRAGAVAAVSHIRNPISAARAVMEMGGSRPVMLVGDAGEAFLLSDPKLKGRITYVSNTYFWTSRRLKKLKLEQPNGQAPATVPNVSQIGPAADQRFGTVGAVSVSKNKQLAVGTSTGGLANKLPGRVGDSPIIGAGTYVDDRACGVSCTGTGEIFIRHAVAHDIVAKMRYLKQNVSDAVDTTVRELPDEDDGGVGGVIALDPNGNHAFAMSPKSIGMYRGYVTETGKIHVAIYKNDEFKVFHAVDKQENAKCATSLPLPSFNKDQLSCSERKLPHGFEAMQFVLLLNNRKQACRGNCSAVSCLGSSCVRSPRFELNRTDACR